MTDPWDEIRRVVGTSFDGLDVYRQTCFNRHDDDCPCTGSPVPDWTDVYAPCPACSKRHAWRECYPDRDVRPEGIGEAMHRHEEVSRLSRDAYYAARPREAP